MSIGVQLVFAWSADLHSRLGLLCALHTFSPNNDNCVFSRHALITETLSGFHFHFRAFSSNFHCVPIGLFHVEAFKRELCSSTFIVCVTFIVYDCAVGGMCMATARDCTGY